MLGNEPVNTSITEFGIFSGVPNLFFNGVSNFSTALTIILSVLIVLAVIQVLKVLTVSTVFFVLFNEIRPKRLQVVEQVAYEVFECRCALEFGDAIPVEYL